MLRDIPPLIDIDPMSFDTLFDGDKCVGDNRSPLNPPLALPTDQDIDDIIYNASDNEFLDFVLNKEEVKDDAAQEPIQQKKRKRDEMPTSRETRKKKNKHKRLSFLFEKHQDRLVVTAENGVVKFTYISEHII